MLSRISNLGVCKICGGKCYLESLIWGWGCKFGVENAFSKLEFGGWKIWGERFVVENTISNLEFGGWKSCGSKCYLESLIWGGG